LRVPGAESGRGLAELTTRNVAHGRVQIDAIEKVEELSSKINLPLFAKKRSPEPL
jgi:hypothetical protein